MADPITHPTFTLHFGPTPVYQFGEMQDADRWQLASTDATWQRRESGRGNVNRIEQLDWAKEWAATQIQEHSSYEVAGWVDPEASDPEPFWVPRLAHVTHRFTVVDTDSDVMPYTAESRRDAEAIQERLLHGSRFVRLRDPKGRDTYVNTEHALVVAYEFERAEVTTE